jgi:hypothetical protein
MTALVLSLVPALFGQQSISPPLDDHQLVLQLLQRVNELEAEVKQLKGAAPNTMLAAVQTAPPPVTPIPVTPSQTTASATPSGTMGSMPGMTLPDLLGLQFRGFADVGFLASTQKGATNSNTSGAHPTFFDGPFNLFMTSRMNDQFSALAEMLIEYGPTNSTSLDLERLELHYTPSDYFNLTAGRFHSAIGYYNTTYHHASWLIPTVTRPFLFAFEDQGGILPTHNVGLSAAGAIPSGALGLHYVAEFGNGRPAASVSQASLEQVQVAQSDKNRKAFNVAAYARPAAIPGLQVGFSVYEDHYYPAGLPKIGQTISDAYVSYHPSGFEFTGEFLELRHDLEGAHKTFHIPGFYSILSKDIGRGVKPYLSWEYINVPRNEPLFGTSIGLRHGPSTGVRYDFTDFAAFKLEYYRLIRRGQADVNGARADLAFTF